MDKIGLRAVQAIEERAEAMGTSFHEERRKVNASPQNVYSWTYKNFAPGAFHLRELAIAGYDVHWILTGERKDNG